MEKDYYKVLQIDSAAESEVVQAAYRKLAQKYHPDASKWADANRRMQEINEAYEAIGDPIKRAVYDRQRKEEIAARRRARAERERSKQPSTWQSDYDLRQKQNAEAQRRAEYDRQQRAQAEAQHRTEVERQQRAQSETQRHVPRANWRIKDKDARIITARKMMQIYVRVGIVAPIVGFLIGGTSFETGWISVFGFIIGFCCFRFANDERRLLNSLTKE